MAVLTLALFGPCFSWHFISFVIRRSDRMKNDYVKTVASRGPDHYENACRSAAGNAAHLEAIACSIVV
jgi:hypothetical protein